MFRVFDEDASFQYLKCFRRVRVNYILPDAAVKARIHLHETQICGQVSKCFFVQVSIYMYTVNDGHTFTYNGLLLPILTRMESCLIDTHTTPSYIYIHSSLHLKSCPNPSKYVHMMALNSQTYLVDEHVLFMNA